LYASDRTDGPHGQAGERAGIMSVPAFWQAVWEQGNQRRTFLTWMAAVNIGFAGANIFFWTTTALLIAQPLSWATWSHIGATTVRPGLWDYPFMLLWVLPLLGTVLANVTNTMGMRLLARFLAAFPMALYGSIIGWWLLFSDIYS
jgi:uncharacterized membrane protein